MPSKVFFISLDANNPIGPPLSAVASSCKPPSPGTPPIGKGSVTPAARASALDVNR